MLPVELKATILKYLKLKTIQPLLTKVKLGSNLIKSILTLRFNLNQTQLANAWKFVDNNQLTIEENFVAVCAASGEAGYEQQLYVDITIALFNAIKAKDLELVIYYITRLTKSKTSDYSFKLNILALLALRTNDINFLIALGLIDNNIFNNEDYYINDIEVLDYNNLLNKVNLSNINISILEDLQHYGRSSLTSYLNVIMNRRCETTDEATEFLLIELQPEALERNLNENTDFPAVLPYTLSDDVTLFITTKVIDRARKMKELILKHFNDNVYRQNYVLTLDILLGLPVVVPKFLPRFICQLALTVMHTQALDQMPTPTDRAFLSEVLYNGNNTNNFLYSKDIYLSLILTNNLLKFYNYDLTQAIKPKIVDLRLKIFNNDYTKVINNFNNININIDDYLLHLISNDQVVGFDELCHLPYIPSDLPITPASISEIHLINNKFTNLHIIADIVMLNKQHYNFWSKFNQLKQ